VEGKAWSALLNLSRYAVIAGELEKSQAINSRA